MKILQNSAGETYIQLDQNEEYDIEEHLQALMDFTCKQAVETYGLVNSYEKIVRRLDELEAKINKAN
ncbi:hypothetical protein Q5692_18900 [Microcoleus sp. C2C3]|uniref:hypothetical protein n=1 Tax=unclassified Microcoleus TaxID=2642155 RepID=UPI002FD11DB7